ncbi:helix-turn-helix domain-containing protein [Allorhodopirellula heiligendammensis]|uniref:Helix-turn-helix domain protein n=1 Tax=Allorhodopirellula heiligendammensis TaxID=2714739 RepID=A0A5C6C1N1_9BACT|nr:helix-turn-helix domain-containing protein [Allorhodopirellula heiligendammensis]TWU18025.1 Helix-turn-helix domain protein [Allorhodopirellula heiligendammensis]
MAASKAARIPERVVEDARATLETLAASRGVSAAALCEAMQPAGETFLTIAEVADILAVDRRTVGRYCDDGLLDAVDVNLSPGGRPMYRITRASFVGLVERMRKVRKTKRKKSPAMPATIKEREARANVPAERRRKIAKRKHLV